MNTAEKVKKLRNERGWSQEELARFADVNKETVNRLELGGGARVSTVKKVAAAFGVPASSLFDDEAATLPGDEQVKTEANADAATLALVAELQRAARDLKAVRTSLPLELHGANEVRELLADLDQAAASLERYARFAKQEKQLPPPIADQLATFIRLSDDRRRAGKQAIDSFLELDRKRGELAQLERDFEARAIEAGFDAEDVKRALATGRVGARWRRTRRAG